MENIITTKTGKKIHITRHSTYYLVSEPNEKGWLDSFGNYFEALAYAKSLD